MSKRREQHPFEQHKRHKSFHAPGILEFPDVELMMQNAENPQELAYAILTSNKVFYSKQEVLKLISKLDQMLHPKFVEPCPYIN